MIHLKSRHQQALLHNNVPQGPIVIGGGFPLNIARYKKTVSNILWVQLTLVACYVPLYIVVVVSGNRTSYVALRATETLGLPKLVPKPDLVLLEDPLNKLNKQ